MTEREQLITLCGKLGANPAQAAAMADQLIKRCDQLVAERGLARMAAMEYLLTLVVKGHAGETPAGFSGGPPPAAPLQTQLTAAFQAAFGRAPTVITAAPGRIEVIGNHTDYNGGPVLGAAVDRRVWVAVAPRTDGVRQFLRAPEGGLVTLAADEPVRQTGDAAWTNYPLGVLAALPAFGCQVPGGFDYAVMSDLPAGAGLSSSAAIELSSALAFLALTEQTVERETLVKIGRHAENHFVGVPCGILDQGVSGFGRKDHLVSIDCRVPSFAVEPLPADARFWMLNTHTKHALVDGLYAERHRECQAAAAALGVALLADATPARVASAAAWMDSVLHRRARHVVEEIARVGEAVTVLRAGDLAQLGRLLTESHRSSQHLFENSTPELDFLVDALEKEPHVHGARLSGGGFGGAVVALTGADFGAPQASAIAAAYAQRFGARPDVLMLRTGDGAARVM
ncbi:galactokinase [Opitutaceae bacterium]